MKPMKPIQNRPRLIRNPYSKQTRLPFVKSPDSALAHSLHIQELLLLTRDAFKKENLRPTKKKDSKTKDNSDGKENKQN